MKQLEIFWFFVKNKLISTLQYRFNILFMIISSMLVILVNISIWLCLYGEQNEVHGVTQSQMIVYTIISNVLSNVFYVSTSGKIASDIRSGNIIYDLIRPFSCLLRYWGEDIGNIFSSFIVRGIPMILLSSFMFVVPLPAGFINFCLFLVSMLFCYCILWLVDAIFGILNFWTVGFGNLSQLANTFVRIFSGSFIPIWFFPWQLQRLLYLTPFPYSYQTAVSIYIGRTEPEDRIRIMTIQILWILILLLLLCVLYKQMRRRIIIQGG